MKYLNRTMLRNLYVQQTTLSLMCCTVPMMNIATLDKDYNLTYSFELKVILNDLTNGSLLSEKIN